MSEAEGSAVGVLAGEGSAPPADAPQAGNPAAWYGEIDQSLVGYIENKGWKSPKDAISGYANLEKLLGADRAGNTVVLPKEGDKDGWGEVYNRLGRPSTAGDYKLDPVDGVDVDVDWFKEKAHAAGLNQEQASMLFREMTEQQQAESQNREQQTQVKQQQDLQSLKKDWGLQYESNVLAGRKAAKQFGLGEEQLNAMEDSLGTRGLLELMAKIGRSIGEDSFETGNVGERGFGLTPAAAQAQIGDLKTNKDFQSAYLDAGHPGHKEAVEKMTRLLKAAYPEV